MPAPLVFVAFLVTISATEASNDATSTGRKALLRQEVSSAAADRQPVASDTIEAELLRTAVELNLPPHETAQVVSASRAVMPRQAEATKMSLRDSVLFAAKRLGLSLHQVDRLKMAMANLDHRSYVHLLQVFEAATAATVSVPAKVAAVVTAAAEANYSAEEVGAAAAAASVSLADDAATTTAPLQSLADAVSQLAGVEGQAAVLSAAGGENSRSQSIIAEMFRAITSTTPPVIPWDSLRANPFGSDPQIVADEIKEEIKDLDIPEQEKTNILAAAMNAAAVAERPTLRMNGTQGLEANFAGDLLALASAAFGAGFTDNEVAMLKLKWQDMTSQQRAAAKRSFDALASARALVGLKDLGKGNLSTSVASALKAFEDAGASAVDAAHVAADVLRAAHAARRASKRPPKDKTGLQQTMENVKSARLSDQQAQAILKVLAGLPPEDVTPLAIAWAAIGGQASAATTKAPSQSEREKGGQLRLSAPTASINLQALEDISVVAFASLQAGMDFDRVERADSAAKGMGPAEQMAAAAAILRQGDPKAERTQSMLKELEIGLAG